ncbi:MAG: FISUMP domain-containing protein [Bacteroidia bacterium]
MKRLVLFTLIHTLLAQISIAQTVSDFDGNVYSTIQIGNQTWMKENLKTTHFNNGVPIPSTTSNVLVDSTSLFQWAYNNDTSNIPIYGRLYTWFAVVNAQNVCPSGWHVPDNSEWVELSNFLGGDTVAGGKMKETGQTHWALTDSSVDNSSQFTGLPAGFRGNPSGFSQLTTLGAFWSTTPFGSSSFQRGFRYELKAGNSQFTENIAVANCGFSVRCIKNATTKLDDVEMKSTIQVFPNPSSTSLQVSKEKQNVLAYYIYNAEGKLIVHENIFNALEPIPVQTLEKGIYIIRIVFKDYEIERKFIKE